MTIGLTRQTEIGHFDSLTYVYDTLNECLPAPHRKLYFERALQEPSAEARQATLWELIGQCDLLLDPGLQILKARSQMDRRPPCFYHLLGEMPRGAVNLYELWPHLNTNDLLVGNCTADLAITNLFFTNARLKLLPFAIRHENFYPLAAAEKNAIRKSLGFSDQEFLLLYPGRITIEKNVHSLIRLFATLRTLVPSARLLVAGDCDDVPFAEFGVSPSGLDRKIRQLPDRLGIPDGGVVFLGRRPPNELRQLYNIADVVVNHTLHHDENFGYAQVEAMACGIPAVGTAWGGLKDTIIDGETGFQIETCVTPIGVKVDWWDALNKLVQLAHEPAREKYHRACVAHARQNYHVVKFAEDLKETLRQLTGRQPAAEPLQPTEFAMEFWQTCVEPDDPIPPYRRGPRALELYQTLIAPYASRSSHSRPQIAASPTLILASPAVLTDPGTIQIVDPIFPMTVAVPAHLQPAIQTILRSYSSSPVQKVSPSSKPEHEAIDWLVDNGILLVSDTAPEVISPASIGSEMAIPIPL